MCSSDEQSRYGDERGATGREREVGTWKKAGAKSQGCRKQVERSAGECALQSWPTAFAVLVDLEVGLCEGIRRGTRCTLRGGSEEGVIRFQKGWREVPGAVWKIKLGCR